MTKQQQYFLAGLREDLEGCINDKEIEALDSVLYAYDHEEAGEKICDISITCHVYDYGMKSENTVADYTESVRDISFDCSIKLPELYDDVRQQAKDLIIKRLEEIYI